MPDIVATTHKDYNDRLPQWTRCRDCATGSDAVKAKGVLYLPALDSHKNNPGKYDEYVTRALYYNATGRTVQALSGAVLQKEPAVVVPPIVEPHTKDITLAGEPLEQFALAVMTEYLTTGRYGILVDMSSEDSVTPRPYWVGYKAESIINWRTTRFGGDEELTMVVLQETEEKEDPENAFGVVTSIRYRVLRLTDGIYTQQIYTQDKNSTSKDYIGGEITTPMRRGAPMDFIPFALPWTLTTPPLLDLVDVSLSHYRGMADLKHGLHYAALPTPWVAGHVDATKPLEIGSGKAWSLGQGGSAGMLEVSGPGFGAIREDLREMQKMMATLGARLIEEGGTVRNEDSVTIGMRLSGDHASLRLIAQVVEQQLTWAMQVHAWWLGVETIVSDVKASVELNKDFMSTTATAEDVKTLLTLLQSDSISFKTFYERLQAGRWTRDGVDADEEQREIAEQEITPIGGKGGPVAPAVATHDADGNEVPPEEATHDAFGQPVAKAEVPPVPGAPKNGAPKKGVPPGLANFQKGKKGKRR